MVKTFTDKYISEDKQNYMICIEEAKNEIIIFISNEKENDSLFFSKYKIDYLKEEFNFKSIQEFKMLLKINVQKKLLSIKKPDKSTINTIWKLYPNDLKDIKKFSLILEKNLEEKISLYFYSNFQKRKNITFMGKYISEDEQHYVICLEETKNEIIISLTNKKEKDSPFTSKYELDYLNQKFGKNYYFKSIQEFRHC